MRKSLENILLIMISVYLTSCIHNKDEEIITLSNNFDLKDIVITKLDLLELGDNTKPLFDSVIDLVIDCPHNINLPIGFVVSSNIDSAGTKHITIENINELSRFDYSRCNGVFYYKGYQFVTIGNGELFKNAGMIIRLISINPKRLKSTFQANGEFYNSYWDFVYVKKEFYCISYHNCGEHWYDDKFYTSE